jgi:hypothetical protein
MEKSIWMIANISIVALIVLGISFCAAMRGNRGGYSTRGILSGTILISLLTVMLYGCLALIYLRTEIKDLQPISLDMKLSPTGQYVLTEAICSEGNPRLWVIPVNEKQRRRVVLRNTFFEDFSPDGNWIIYFSQQNWIGLVSNFLSLRACRIDGSDDRVLIPDFADWDRLAEQNPNDEIFFNLRNAISSDGIRVAFNNGSDLYVANLDRHTVKKVRLSSAFGNDYHVIGFHPNGVEVLLLSSGRCLIACNPIEGKCRVLLEAGHLRKAWYFDGFHTPRKNKSTIRRILFGYQLFDVESATTRLLPDRGKDLDNNDHSLRADLSQDQRTLAYAVRSDSNSASPTTRIHTYAIETGVDDLISTIPEHIRNLFISPSGNSIAITHLWLAANPETPEIEQSSQVTIIQSKKLIRSFTGWNVLGWASESEVILVQNYGPGRIKLMAAGDIATGNIRQFYP